MKPAPAQEILGFFCSPRRLLAFAIWFLRFGAAFLSSNWQVLGWVLWRRRSDLHPDFIAYPVAGLRRWEIVWLAQAITLTPGTTSVELSADGGQLVIHALDARDPSGVCAAIDRELRDPMLAFSRP